MKNLTASELLEFVDFVKNEKVYTARIQELEKLESQAREAAGIVKTLDEAKALEAAAKAKSDALDAKHKELKISFEQKEQELKKQYEELKSDLYAKVAKERLQFEQVRDMINEQRKLEKELAAKDEQLSRWSVQLSNQQAAIRKLDQTIRDKATRIKAISEE